MNCPYCRAHNNAGDHRCSRCGRRLDEASGRPAMFPVQQSAAAPALDLAATPESLSEPQRPHLVTEPARPGSGNGGVVQPSLFGPMEVSRTSVSQRESTVRTDPPAPARRKADRPQQGKLDFDPRAEVSPISARAAVYRESRVADAGQRCAAAIIDTVLPAGLLAVFLATSRLVSGQLELQPMALGIYAFAAVIAVLLYRLVFCFGGADTPGLQWTGLRLLDFDGHRPDRRARLYRLAGGLVSLLAAGIGLAWALFDEERLTWHDHMTATFPSPRY